MKVYTGLITLAFIVLSSCTSALPNKLPLKELEEYAIRAEHAQAEARAYALQAQGERERAEMLAAEARADLQRAEAAERRCAESLRRIPKGPRKVITVKPEGAEPEAKPGENPVDKKKDEPPYSPSDAPVGK